MVLTSDANSIILKGAIRPVRVGDSIVCQYSGKNQAKAVVDRIVYGGIVIDGKFLPSDKILVKSVAPSEMFDVNSESLDQLWNKLDTSTQSKEITDSKGITDSQKRKSSKPIIIGPKRQRTLSKSVVQIAPPTDSNDTDSDFDF